MNPPLHIIEQRPAETIKQVVHRHWFNIAMHFLILFCIAALIVAGFIIVPIVSAPYSIVIEGPLLTFFETLVLLLLWIYGFLIWIDYYFDVWVITDQRIINIEQKGLFKRVTSELELSRVQDVTTDISGFIPTLLDFGDVLVQTAGEQDHFVFRQIACPNDCKNEIMHLAKHLP